MREIALYDYDKLSQTERAALLRRTEDDLSDYIEKVAPVIEEVRLKGDEAIAHFVKKFDGAEIDPAQILATEAEFDAAFDALDDEFIEVLRYAADNIRRFHEMQKPQDIWWTEIRPGVKVGERATPLDTVALYSPRGKGSFPSVTLMTAIPAVVAGVRQPVILTPPGPNGEIDPATLVAARLSGVEMVGRAGGPLAVAAAAFGTTFGSAAERNFQTLVWRGLALPLCRAGACNKYPGQLSHRRRGRYHDDGGDQRSVFTDTDYNRCSACSFSGSNRGVFFRFEPLNQVYPAER